MKKSIILSLFILITIACKKSGDGNVIDQNNDHNNNHNLYTNNQFQIMTPDDIESILYPNSKNKSVLKSKGLYVIKNCHYNKYLHPLGAGPESVVDISDFNPEGNMNFRSLLYLWKTKATADNTVEFITLSKTEVIPNPEERALASSTKRDHPDIPSQAIIYKTRSNFRSNMAWTLRCFYGDSGKLRCLIINKETGRMLTAVHNHKHDWTDIYIDDKFDTHVHYPNSIYLYDHYLWEIQAPNFRNWINF